MAINVRQELGRRLSHELKRRGLGKYEIPDLPIPASEIREYIQGKHEIKLDQIEAICNAIGMNSLRLISSGYTRSKLTFRQAGNDASQKAQQRFALEIEDAFMTALCCFPKTIFPDLPLDYLPITKDPFELIIGLCAFLDKFQFKTVEEILSATNIILLPVIPPDAVDFDAFLITTDTHAAICVNTLKPTVRIHFSLLHEMSHFLFDRASGSEIDAFAPNLYASEVDFKNQSEFIANKFAQFMLIDWQWAMRAANHWGNICGDELQEKLNQGRASPAVLVNAVFDFRRNVVWGSYGAMDFKLYNEIQDYVINKKALSGDASFIQILLQTQKVNIQSALHSGQNQFSSDVFTHLAETLQVGQSHVVRNL